MVRLVEVSHCNECPHFALTFGCCHHYFSLYKGKPGHFVPITINQYRDKEGNLHDHRFYKIPDWCPLPERS